ncbi:MAG: HAMP domain-containing sensor histidine kinase, partial [bacterium]
SVDEETRGEIRTVLGISVLYLIFGLLVSFIVFRTLVEPVQRLTVAVQKFGRGEPPQEVEVETGDELETLAREFNKMTDSIIGRDRELAQTNAQLLEANRVKAQFLANISHELKTPLNSIIGFSQLLLEGMEGGVSEGQKEDLSIILASGRHLLQLISQILDYAKIEAGREELKPERVNSTDLLRECFQAFKPMSDERGLELTLALDGALPPITADRTKLRQILLNLISNALKFTDHGSVEVGASGQNGLLTVWVRDSGIGIDEAEQVRIFEPFYQADSGVTRKYSGSGLGLTIAKSYVDLHGGKIWVESAPGHGSSFYVQFPVDGPPA